MKRVLITGGAGFIGHHVIRYFLKNTDYEFVDFHSARPGHDLRYALDGSLMKSFGWNVNKDVYTRIEEVVKWSLKNDRWLKY